VYSPTHPVASVGRRYCVCPVPPPCCGSAGGHRHASGTAGVSIFARRGCISLAMRVLSSMGVFGALFSPPPFVSYKLCRSMSSINTR